MSDKDEKPLVTLSRDQILGANDCPTETVEIPEWGGKIRLRSISAGERDAFETAIFQDKQEKKRPNIRARLVALCAIDDEGKRLFSDLEANLLAKKNGRIMDRISDAASKLNGLGPEDIKELEKNSDEGPTEEFS